MELYTIKDIIAQTGLSFNYVNKCTNQLSDILKKYSHRGTNNSRLFTSSALVIFDRIKQFKESGMSLAEIKIQLEGELKSILTDDSESIQTGVQTGMPGDVVKIMARHQAEIKEEMEKRLRLQADKDRLIREKEEIIKDLEKERDALSGSIKLLTDGKTPEQARRDKDTERERKIVLKGKLEQLEGLGMTAWWQRRKLWKEIKELLEHPNG